MFGRKPEMHGIVNDRYEPTLDMHYWSNVERGWICLKTVVIDTGADDYLQIPENAPEVLGLKVKDLYLG